MPVYSEPPSRADWCCARTNPLVRALRKPGHGHATGRAAASLPAHSHIVATANSGQSEWWNVDVVGVKSLSAWNKLITVKSDRELQYLQRHDSATVTGNIPTNLFLYFAVRR